MFASESVDDIHVMTILDAGSGLNYAAVRNERSRRFKQSALAQFDAWARNYDHSVLNQFLFRPAYLLMLPLLATIADA